MTKDNVEKVVKRYRYVHKAIEQNLETITFYIGKRKQKLHITNEVKIIYEIINDVYSHIGIKWLSKMIKGILKGKSDTYLITQFPYERSTYYKIKQKFIEKIYRCCIAKQMVAYEELIKEEMAQ